MNENDLEEFDSELLAKLISDLENEKNESVLKNKAAKELLKKLKNLGSNKKTIESNIAKSYCRKSFR